MARAVAQPPAQERSRRTEQNLLDALERSLASNPMVELTVAEIAAEAGLTTGAIYRRFKDKRDLLHSAFDRFLENSAQSNAIAEVADATLSDEAILRNLITGTLFYTLDHIPLMRAAAACNDIPSYDRMREARNVAIRRLTADLTTSTLSSEELERRTRFIMRTVTAVIRDTFLSGPGAMDVSLSRKAFVRKNKKLVNRLITDLLDLAVAYLHVQRADRE